MNRVAGKPRKRPSLPSRDLAPDIVSLLNWRDREILEHEISRLQPRIITTERATINYFFRKRTILLPPEPLRLLLILLREQKGFHWHIKERNLFNSNNFILFLLYDIMSIIMLYCSNVSLKRSK